MQFDDEIVIDNGAVETITNISVLLLQDNKDFILCKLYNVTTC